VGVGYPGDDASKRQAAAVRPAGGGRKAGKRAAIEVRGPAPAGRGPEGFSARARKFLEAGGLVWSLLGVERDQLATGGPWRFNPYHPSSGICAVTAGGRTPA